MGQFWAEVVEKITKVTGIQLRREPLNCLLAEVRKPKKKKLTYKLLQLMLVLARRRIAISWMGQKGPDSTLWLRDVREWSLAEEIRMKIARRDEKAVDDILAWRELCTAGLAEGDPSPQSPDAGSGSETVGEE